MTRARIYEIVADECCKPTVLTGQTFEELGFDSLDYLALVSRIEQESGLEIPGRAVAAFRSVGHLADFVGEKQCA